MFLSVFFTLTALIFFFFSYFLCDFTTAAKNQGMAVKLMSFFFTLYVICNRICMFIS